ncbi:MAG: vWA domain-containing protein [Albidovulum sp.]
MNDELDRLRDGLRAAPPAPDPQARVQTLRRAMESFDRHQENRAALRPMSDRPDGAGFLTGVRRMLSHLSPRATLAATASVAVIGLALALYPQFRQTPGLPGPQPEAVPERPAGLPGTSAAAPDAVMQAAEDMAEHETAMAPLPEVAAAEPMAPPVPAPGPMPARTRELGAPAGLAVGGPDLAAPEAMIRPYPADTETFAHAGANPVKIVTEEPVSTFAVDVDTASWPVIRSSLEAGVLPPKEAVRIEEMVNYFPYSYPAPEAGEAPFRASVNLFPTPWNDGTMLLRIGLQGKMPAVEDRPPLNLVFLIDTSGSMQDANKLPLLKQSLRLLLGQLRPDDRVAMVSYAGSAGLVLESTAASERNTILGALDRLEAGGSTAGQEGLVQAYQVAADMADEGRVSRVLLATDGDFNVGLSDPAELADFIAGKRESGIYLSVLGFGRGNLDDATMQALAQNGNGTAAYIDTAAEAQKVLVDQLTGALFPIADDVKVQVEFNPAAVAEYRLIGYETRALAREDFNNDRVDAGEIGAGHQVTALYEITPADSPARLTDPLRYGSAPAQDDAAELGFLKLRYKAPGESTSRLIALPIPAAPGEADADARFAAAIAGMGQLLSGSKYLGDWGWDAAIALASGAKGEDPFGYRAEAVRLMRLAQSLAR